MRIRDWSSDVCSSDLPAFGALRDALSGYCHLSRPPTRRHQVNLEGPMSTSSQLSPTGASHKQAADETATRSPLHGLVVADFSRVLAGPVATMLLADLGAEVISVERPSGDDTRHWVPPLRVDVGTYYSPINRNKGSIALDLKDEHGE